MYKNNVIMNKCIILCILVIFLGCFFTIFKYVTSKILVEMMQIDNYFTRMVVDDYSLFNLKEYDKGERYNWGELYPVDEKNNNDNDIDTNKIEHISAFVHKNNQPADRLNDWSKKNFILYYKFLENSKRFEDFLGWQEIPVQSPANHSPAIKLSDGYLINTTTKRSMVERGKKTAKFYEWCNSMDIPFLYIQLPSKVMPSYLSNDFIEKQDKCNDNYDEFMNYLRNRNVPCIDIRDNIIQENIDWHSLFFRTDHHWKLESGLWASDIILKIINDKYSLFLDENNLKKENFVYEVYKKCFLGSIGKKLTLTRTDPDDIVLLYPKFETDIEYRVMSDDVNINTDGDFSIYYNKALLTSGYDYYHSNAYCTYGYDHAVNYFHNNLSNNKTKILLLMDSYSLTIIPFLGLAVNDIRAIDLRVFRGSIKKYILEYTPDIVLVMYGDTQRLDNEAIVDFR